MAQKFGKLVRDHIPDIIRTQGRTPAIRILGDGEYLRCLNDKLLEEAHEFLANNCVEELCDLLEVIDALAETLGYSREDIERTHAEKAARNGRFERRIYLEEVTDEHHAR